MRVLVSIFLFLTAALCSTGQGPVGTWTDHLRYDRSFGIAAGEEKVFSSTGNSVLVYDKTVSDLRKLSKVNGLTETGISAIAWSEQYQTLVIVYNTANVDLLIKNVVYNIPDIKLKYIPGEKKINKVRISGKYAYLACSFGIVVIDIDRKEIYDSWKPGASNGDVNVSDISFSSTNIYAATDKGIYTALKTNPGLSFFGNWNIISSLPNPTGKYTLVMYAGGKLYANLSYPLLPGDYMYVVDQYASVFLYEPGVFYNSADASGSGFTVSASGSVKFFSQTGSLVKTITYNQWQTSDIAMAVESGGDIWIADRRNGMIRAEKMSSLSRLILPGPASDNAYSITSAEGKTIITGGGTTASWNNQWKPLQISVYENNHWLNILSGTISDPLYAAIDPADNNHFFVSTWGGGLLEYRNNELVKQYTNANSPLQTIIPGQPYVRIAGLAFDEERNLWITQTEVQGNIKVLKPDGTWFYDPGLEIDAPTIGEIIVARNGYKWVVLPRGYGIFILDDNGTPEDFSDDRSKKMYVRDNEGNVASNVYSITSDLDGNIWAGTDQGPFIYYNPENVFRDGYSAFRIKIPRNDGTNLADYMLGTESITSIFVDGGNRKWMGTYESGAYLLSPDGTEQLLSFNERNSPLLSNYVTDISVDNKTGEVWFATINGIQSYRGNSTEGNRAFSNVYAFPNPVREDFTGNVTITGLIVNTEIRITDISGNLVFSTMSDGGLASWDLKNSHGNRVATGVYIVFCTSPGVKQTAITKILVIH
ncbi:MAG TPA: T9SS type A sorting domain-containing protein [Bacteroidales bacterium]|nr:T9SS type A sorting domain-containing protein [Bacteroidales bacterium]